MAVTPDAVKFEIGGVPKEAKDLLTDDKIQQIITIEQTLEGSAARCAEILSRLFASKADEAIGDYRVTYADVARRWAEIAKRMRSKSAVPIVGGLSKSEKAALWLDEDAVKPDFWRGMMENYDW